MIAFEIALEKAKKEALKYKPQFDGYQVGVDEGQDFCFAYYFDFTFEKIDIAVDDQEFYGCPGVLVFKRSGVVYCPSFGDLYDLQRQAKIVSDVLTSLGNGLNKEAVYEELRSQTNNNIQDLYWNNQLQTFIINFKNINIPSLKDDVLMHKIWRCFPDTRFIWEEVVFRWQSLKKHLTQT